MARTVRSMVLGSLVLAMLACGLPGSGQSGPTAKPSEVPISAEPTPTASPEPPPPADFAEVLGAEVAAGKVSYEEGLIRMLRSFLGDPEAALPDSYETVTTREGSGIVMLAFEYIASGSNEDAKAKMQRLLDLLVPTAEQLEAYSRPAGARSSGPGLAQPPAQIDCATLWTIGFPVGDAPMYDCFIAERGSVSGAASYTIYFPAEWETDASRRVWSDRTEQAVVDALTAYREYGAFDDIGVVFSVVPGMADVLAAAHPLYEASRGETCPVVIYPLALALDEAPFKQTVAHEVFHCFQFLTLRPQSLVSHDATKWWSEASAEYFSNVVYPDVNFEDRWADAFDYNSKNTPLYQMGYENFGFFQFLANRWGDSGVITFLESMPTSGGRADQADRLAAWPGMQDIFHEFGQDYLDYEIIDSDGNNIPFSPVEAQRLRIPRGSFSEEITPQPFVLDRRTLVFVEDTRFDVRAEETEGDGRNAAEHNFRTNSWGPLPVRVNTACANNQYLLLVTSAVPIGESPVTLTIETTGEEVEHNDECDSCLIGTWTLSNSSYLAHLGGLWPFVVGLMPSFGLSTDGAEAHPTGVSGVMRMRFNEDGTAEGLQEAWTVSGEATQDGDTVRASMAYGGAGEAYWRVVTDESGDQKVVFFDEGTFSLTGQMVFQGFPLDPRPTGGSNDPIFLSTPQPYICTDTTLTYYADDPLGPVVFIRGTGEE